MISGTGNRSRADRTQGLPSAGWRSAQSLHENNRYSSGSTTRAASFQSKINDRATVVTWTGCHCRFKTKVGRSSTPFDIIASIPGEYAKNLSRTYSSNTKEVMRRFTNGTLRFEQPVENGDW